MKKLSLILLGVLFLLNNGIISAQKKPFKGKIVYSVNYEGRELTPNEKMQMPTEVEYLFGDGKIKQTTKTAMGNVVLMQDLNEKKIIMLLDLMGNKIAVVEPDTAKKSIDKDVKFEKIDESKTIAGQKCKKMKISKGDTVMEVFYAEDLYVPKGTMLYGFDERLENIPLQYTLPTQDEDLTITYKAKEITPMKKVKKKEFRIPADYQQVTKEELKKMFGGGGQ
jgi:hypothetical protein